MSFVPLSLVKFCLVLMSSVKFSFIKFHLVELSQVKFKDSLSLYIKSKQEVADEKT